jgi:hypothetical protein
MRYVLNHVKLIKPFFSSLLSRSGIASVVTKHTLEEVIYVNSYDIKN